MEDAKELIHTAWNVLTTVTKWVAWDAQGIHVPLGCSVIVVSAVVLALSLAILAVSQLVQLATDFRSILQDESEGSGLENKV